VLSFSFLFCPGSMGCLIDSISKSAYYGGGLPGS